MILEADASQLEWRVAADLSKDPVMLQEIATNIDQHQASLDEVFKGKGERVDAKIFNFRMIYKTSAWGLYNDPKMPPFSQDQYQKMINTFMAKYSRLAEWHQELIKEVYRTGQLVNPNGRVLKFDKVDKKDGSRGYNVSQIANYPVQSFAFDLVALAIAMIRKRIRNMQAKLVMIVHDSGVFDVPEEEVSSLARICVQSFSKVPALVKHYWGYTMDVPIDSEVKVGPSWGEMEVYDES